MSLCVATYGLVGHIRPEFLLVAFEDAVKQLVPMLMALADDGDKTVRCVIISTLRFEMDEYF